MKKAPSFSIQPGESVTDWIRRTAAGLIDHALTRKSRPAGDRAETVHLIRVTVKQLRALLRLLRPVIRASVFDREDARLKAAADRLSAGRDFTVALKTLTTLAESADDSDRLDLLHLKAVLRHHGAAFPQNRLSAASLAASFRDLETSRRALMLMRITDTGWTSLDLAEQYRRARKRMNAAAEHPKVKVLHHWRIAVKRLYYQIQWLQPLWPKCFCRMEPLLHDLERALGTHHDVFVLKQLLLPSAGPKLDPACSRLLRSAIRQRSKHLRHRSLSLGKKIFPHSSSRFAEKFQRRAAHPDW